MGRICFSAAAAAVVLRASAAVACPLCRSETGRQVREGILDGGFGGTLLALLLPFLAITLVVSALHGGPPERPADGDPIDPPR